MSKPTVNQAQAIYLCQLIENICPEFGCHVALTGGCLYKEGQRKDVDIMFYRTRQCPKIDVTGLFEALETHLGIERITHRDQWCIKAKYSGISIDFFFPEPHGKHPVLDDYEHPQQ